MGCVTVKQAARMLQCPVARVRRMIDRGDLVGSLELDPKSSRYSGNMRWEIDRRSVEAAAKAAEGKS